ncbi:disulfide bond formation protein B [Hirschia baltica]|uniref:Disulfide bond formation protein B n=1 Tax=Hirschia baltica (strain ATCC 49814 / DSM 5838 / IFAM 1418) TaxID=582402 RepID=C6XLU3_HIRBI|nr:disulfide bond formation protein B [Hirschia baltica]ACT57999.1 conserved hypothetical protein [Hirschia baltica ATCC 49814]
MMNSILSQRTWIYVSLLASIFMLASAHVFETFGKMYPCDLCLKQREPYWVAIFIALSGIILSRAKPSWPMFKTTCILLGFTFLYGTGYALYHSGVEWGIFHAGCQSVDFDPSQSLALDSPMVVGKCDEPPLVIMGVTMANMNAIGSMLLMLTSFVCAFRKQKN